MGEEFLQTTFLPTPDLEVECRGFAVDSKERTLLTACNTTMGYPALTVAGLDDPSPINNLRVIEYPSIPDIAELIVDNCKLFVLSLFSSWLSENKHILSFCHMLMLMFTFLFKWQVWCMASLPNHLRFLSLTVRQQITLSSAPLSHLAIPFLITFCLKHSLNVIMPINLSPFFRAILHSLDLAPYDFIRYTLTHNKCQLEHKEPMATCIWCPPWVQTELMIA